MTKRRLFVSIHFLSFLQVSKAKLDECTASADNVFSKRKRLWIKSGSQTAGIKVARLGSKMICLIFCPQSKANERPMDGPELLGKEHLVFCGKKRSISIARISADKIYAKRKKCLMLLGRQTIIVDLP